MIDKCPHGVPKPVKFTFDPAKLPRQCNDSDMFRVWVCDAEACPACLAERVANLRKACDLLSRGPGPDYVEGLELYRDDLANHYR